MRHGAVDRQFGSNSDPDDHEAELVVQAVGQNPPQVVLDHGVEDRERGHHRADPDQHLGAGVAARKRIHRELGGEGREPDRPGDRGLGIGVLQPVVQQRECTLYSEGEENQPAARRADAKQIEPDRAARLEMHHRASEQQHAGCELHQQIAHRSAPRPFRAPRPDEHDRSRRRELPVDEQRDQVAGEHRAERAAGIRERRDLLVRIILVQRVDDVEQRGDREDVAESEAQTIDTHQHQRLAQEAWLHVFARRHHHEVGESEHRQRKHPHRANAATQERYRERPENQDQRGRELNAHSSSPGV